MRKFMTFLLTLALLSSLGTTAIAAEPDTTRIDVILKYTSKCTKENKKHIRKSDEMHKK